MFYKFVIRGWSMYYFIDKFWKVLHSGTRDQISFQSYTSLNLKKLDEKSTCICCDKNDSYDGASSRYIFFKIPVNNDQR